MTHTIPFKDQTSAYVVKKRLTDLSSQIKTTIQSVFISGKLNKDLKVHYHQLGLGTHGIKIRLATYLAFSCSHF